MVRTLQTAVDPSPIALSPMAASKHSQRQPPAAEASSFAMRSAALIAVKTRETSDHQHQNLAYENDANSPMSNVDLHRRAPEYEIIPQGNIQYNRNSCFEGQLAKQNKPLLTLEKKSPQLHRQQQQHIQETDPSAFLQSQQIKNHNNNNLQSTHAAVNMNAARMGKQKTQQRMNSTTDRSKRYDNSHNNTAVVQQFPTAIKKSTHDVGGELGGNGPQHNESSSYQSNGGGHQFNSQQPKPIVQNQRLLPERVDNTQQQQPVTTVMGLGLGMGIQIGADGRFFASMGGVTMPGGQPILPNTAEPLAQYQYQNSPISNGMVSPNSQQLSKQQKQQINNNLAGGRMTMTNQKQSPGTAKRREIKIKQGNLDGDYQEIFQNVHAEQARLRVRQQNQHQMIPTQKQDESHNHHYNQYQQQQQQQQGFDLRSPQRRSEVQADNSNEMQLVGNKMQAPNHHQSHHVPLGVSIHNGVGQKVVSHPSELNNSKHQRELQNLNQRTHNQSLPNTNQPIKKSHRMNSTNETSFTEQHNHSQQLISSNLEAATSTFSMGNGLNGMMQVKVQPSSNQQRAGINLSSIVQAAHYENNTTTNLSPKQSDSRPFIAMKHKVVESSKNLKHDIAHQIIAANPAKVRQLSNTNHTRKGSLMSIGQAQLPQLKLQNEGRTTSLPQDNDLNTFYQQITSDNTILRAANTKDSQSMIQMPISQQQQTALLSKNQNFQMASGNVGAPLLKKTNSLEHLLASKAAGRNNLQNNIGSSQSMNLVANQHHVPHISQGQYSLNRDNNNYNTNVDESQKLQQVQSLQQQPMQLNKSAKKGGLNYRVMSEKRTSQPPPVMGANSGTAADEQQQDMKNHKRQLMRQHVESMKRSSIQELHQYQQALLYQQQMNPPSSTNIESHNQQQQSNEQQQPNSKKKQHQIYKKEIAIEAQTNKITVTSPGAPMPILNNNEPFLSPANAEWIRKAIEASKQGQQQQIQPSQTQEQNNNDSSSFLNQFQNENSPQQMGSPTNQQQQIPPIQARSSPTDYTSIILDINGYKADIYDTNVKRAREVIEQKKMQLEQMKDQRWHFQFANNNQAAFAQQLDQQQSALEQQFIDQQKYSQTSPGLVLGNQVMGNDLRFNPIEQQTQGGAFVSNLNYRQILPAQQNQAQQQNSSKMRNLAEHPLQSQQLLNGYSKNVAANHPTGHNSHNRHMRNNSNSNSKGSVDKSFVSSGIQGKNITIMHQNKAIAQQASLMRQLQNSGKNFANVEGDDALLLKELEMQLNPEDFKAVQLIQQQLQKGGVQLSNSQSRKNLLQAMHAAETGQIQPSIQQAMGSQSAKQRNKKESAFFQFGVSRQNQGKLIVFNHNGQTYIRSNDSNKLYNVGKTPLEAEDEPMQQLGGGPQSPNKKSNAAMMADQMVQLSIGSRSLSKMLQGAQLEAVIQQINKSQFQLSQDNMEMNNQQRGNYLNTIQIANGIELHEKLSPTSQQMRINSRQERVSSKVNLGASQKRVVQPGESNGSLSTKPATSTTISSTTKGKEPEELKKNFLGKEGAAKKGKKGPKKQRVVIFHEWDENLLKDHKINKAINTINSIIRLIFKNNKDSLAITTTNQNSGSLNCPPANRLIEEYRIVELQKLAKQISINIPRKFDSKSSLREFFYSREFILNVKNKMQGLLHKAILSANNLPISVIEANMFGNQALATGPSDTKKVYQAKKFFVGPGNNFPIVKSVLKQRYWWQQGSEENFASDVDFVWTSWKKQKHIDYLSKVNNQNKAKITKREQETAATGSAVEATQSHNNETQQKITTNQSQDNNSSTNTNGRGAMPTLGNRKRKQPQTAEQKEIYATPAQAEKVVFPFRLYNRVEQNKQLTNKKGLFVNMRKYYETNGQDPFKVLPLTFHTTQGVNDPEYRKFANCFNQVEQRFKQSERQIKEAIKQHHSERKVTAKTKKGQEEDYGSEVDSDDEEAIEKIKKKLRAPHSTWIIKPGENSNRGMGITVVKTIREIESIIGRPSKKDGDSTFIIQKYIDYPLLVHKRKFDFRCFGLLTSINGSLKGYCYQDGYIRTSCREYSLDDVTDQFIHLTNDAIQQKAEEYGKFENGNKMSWQDFTKVVCAQQPELDFDFHRDIFPQIQKLISDTYKAAINKIDPQRLQNTFELFGYDFMLDENFRLYLIEVNTNPCLEVCCPLLARIIPEILDNSFKIVLDPLFPSPDLSHNRKFQLNELPQEVKFQLVFDEDTEGEQIRETFNKGVRGKVPEAVQEEDIESDKENELAEEDGDAY